MNPFACRDPFRVASSVAFVAALCAPGSVAAQEPEGVPPMFTGGDIEAIALSRSPMLVGAWSEWIAALREAEAAGAIRPQPQVSLETAVGPGMEGAVSVRETATLGWMFYWPGVRARLDDPALARVREAAFRFEQAVLDVRFEVRSARIELALAEAQRSAIEEQRHLLADVVEHIGATSGLGEDALMEATRMSIMLGMLDERAEMADGMRARAESMLSVLVGDVGGAALPPAEPLAPWLIEHDRPLPEAESILAAIEQRSPELAAIESSAVAAEANAEIMRDMRRPMPEVMLGWERMLGGQAEDDSAPSMIMLGLRSPLPIFTRQFDAAGDAELAMSDALRAMRSQRLRELQGEALDALASIASARARLDTLRTTLIPLASDVVALLSAGISAGMETYTELLLAVQQQVEIAWTERSLRFEIASELARLDYLTAGALVEAISPEVAPEPLTVDRFGGEP